MIEGKKKQFLIQILRRSTYKWPPRWEAEKRSKLERNTYYCENPECGIIGPKKMFQIDHDVPCVDPEKGWQGLDDYADRMLCEAAGLVRLCIPCHELKTSKELEIRIKNKVSKNKK